MEISLRGMEQLSQAERPWRAEPLDLLLPGKKWLYPCCLETRDSSLPRNISLFFHCHFLASGLASHFFIFSLSISHAVFLCLLALPFIPLPTLSFCIDFSKVSYKHSVSRTTEVSAFRVFLLLWLTCHPQKYLWQGERNHLHPNRLRIGVAVVFCFSTIPNGTCWSQM